MASSDHEMVDLTSPASSTRAHHQDAIVIDSSVSNSRASSPDGPDATSTPTHDRVFKLDDFLGGHRGPDDTGDTTDHATIDPPTSASVTPQTPTLPDTSTVTVADTSTAGPKQKKPKRRVSRSPSPLPAPPPPMLTVRLEWALPRPGTAEHNEKYSVNIREMARDSGQRHATPVPASRPMDSDDDGAKGDTSAVEGAGKEVKRRRKKRREEDSEYDLSDAFIDDSDLQRDSRTHFAQTKQQGFYVSSGDVALVKDKQAPKPRKRAPVPSKPLSKVATTKAAQSRVASTSTTPMLTSGAPVYKRTPSPPPPTASAPLSAASLPRIVTPSTDPGFKPDLSHVTSFSSEAGEGTRHSPIALDDLESKWNISGTSPGAAYGTKRQRTETNGANGSGTITPGGSINGVKKQRKTGDEPFSAEMEKLFAELQQEVDTYSWENKAKFPPNLKPRLTQVAAEALRLGEYGENFFNRLPKIFPYNRFTMMKLTKRLIYATHNDRLRRRCDELMVELKELVDQGLSVQESLHQAAVEGWESKKTSALAKWQEEMEQAQANGVLQEQLPVRPDPPMPQKRYRWNDVIKENVWQQVCLCNEIAALANEAHGFDPNIAQKLSEQSLRKSLYQKIVGVFPEGWLTSNLISREVSEMKRKEKKANDTGEADDDEDQSHA
ncbi:cbinuclein conserved middle domain [Ceratobasidium sp. AG-Ba]|nr:cbinuclein conserved middle domain [Ceratobasidium sp. AG-Ba]QRV99427.1 cbinuclein conserved middle domain [Ceratobasidium sp. AG-Ba]